MTNGAITYEGWSDDDGSRRTWRWESAEALAAAWWADQARPDPDGHVGPAWECVYEMTGAPDPRVLDVIQWLVDLAPDDDGRGLIGAGPLEDLVSHSANGAKVVDEVEKRARQSPNFRLAVEGLWLSPDVGPDVRARLAKFGATLLDD